jgi:hypothetical protein
MEDIFIDSLFDDIYKNIEYKNIENQRVYSSKIILPQSYILFPSSKMSVDFENKLEKLNIKVINFDPLDKDFSGLEHILLRIMNETHFNNHNYEN